MKVNFRYSQSELIAFLILKGYKYNKIEVVKNNRHKDKYRVYFYIEGDKNNLIQLENDFKNKDLSINIKEYIKILKNIKEVIKVNINKPKNKEGKVEKRK